jgi:hypothetical protein
VIVKNRPPLEHAISSTTRPVFAILQTIALSVRNEVVRGAGAIDSCLDAFYLPMEAQEQKKRCKPDKADPIRLHGLGVRW